jgi:hypothetical protein
MYCCLIGSLCPPIRQSASLNSRILVTHSCPAASPISQYFETPIQGLTLFFGGKIRNTTPLRHFISLDNRTSGRVEYRQGQHVIVSRVHCLLLQSCMRCICAYHLHYALVFISWFQIGEQPMMPFLECLELVQSKQSAGLIIRNQLLADVNMKKIIDIAVYW